MSISSPTIIREDQKTMLSNLCSGSKHRNKLLLPDDDLYPNTFDDQSIVTAGKKICVWLGIKPSDLAFSVDQTSRSSLLKYDGQYHLNIAGDFAKNTYIGSALLARLCIEYLLAKHHYPTSPELVEQATIELGLGVLMLNAINSDNSVSSHINRLFPTRKLSVNKDLLQYFTPQEYLRHCEQYSSDHELDKRVIIEHTLPWVQAWLNKPTNVYRDEVFVSKAKSLVRKQRIKFTGCSLLIIFLIVSAAVLLMHQPKKLSVELQTQKETIETYRRSYQACEDGLTLKRDNYDSSDIFMVRQLDAQASRCISLRNNHDYLVKDYNQKLEKAGLQ